MMDSKLSVRAKEIDLMVYDFDGVMTDNRVIVFQDGTEAVIANCADGLGVGRFRSLGIPQLIESTETGLVVKARAGKLHIEVIDSCKDKKNALENYCVQNGYDLTRVLYVENDLNDLEVMKIVGFPVAPSDVHPEIEKMMKLTTEAKGGKGVVKELSDCMVVC